MNQPGSKTTKLNDDISNIELRFAFIHNQPQFARNQPALFPRLSSDVFSKRR